MNDIFNLFLNTFLVIFEHCFPLQHLTLKAENNEWHNSIVQMEKYTLCA